MPDVAERPRRGFWRSTFSSLRVPNYRLYFTGQSVSLAGTWMQMTAQSWLVLVLTHSSTDLGFVVALQTLPVLLLAPYGGVVADRVDKRRLMIVLQIAMGLQALVLGLLTVTGAVTLWAVCLLAVVLGLNNAFENSTRQAFVREMVGRDELRNAITLNSVTVNAARAVGPAIGGVLIATVGVGVCFLLNAASFVAVVTSLIIMDTAALRPSPPAPRARGQLREGLRYAARTPDIAIPVAMMGLVGLLAYEFQVSIPVLARQTFHGGSEAYGFLTAAMGIGAVVGGLFTAARGRTGLRSMIIAGTGFGLAIIACRGTGHRPRVRGHAVRRLGQRFLHRDRQLNHSASGRAEHARPCDSAVAGGLPGHHAHRRPADRLDHRGRQPPYRPRRRRRILPGRRRGRKLPIQALPPPRRAAARPGRFLRFTI